MSRAFLPSIIHHSNVCVLFFVCFCPFSLSLGALSQYNNQSMVRREVFHMPTEVNTRTNVSHTVVNDPFFSGTPKHRFNLRSAKQETKQTECVAHVCSLTANRRDDDEHAAHGDFRHGHPPDHQGSGSEERCGRSHRHQEVVL